MILSQVTLRPIWSSQYFKPQIEFLLSFYFLFLWIEFRLTFHDVLMTFLTPKWLEMIEAKVYSGWLYSWVVILRLCLWVWVGDVIWIWFCGWFLIQFVILCSFWRQNLKLCHGAGCLVYFRVHSTPVVTVGVT